MNVILFQTFILQFQKRKYAKMKWNRFGKKGFGPRMLEDISAGQFLIEYVGEVTLDFFIFFNACWNYSQIQVLAIIELIFVFV